MKSNSKPSNTPADNDENALLIKRRARHRLLGAIALVLTSIVVLPMVFDKNPPPLNKDLSIEIPAQDSTWQTQAKPTQNKPLANINTNTTNETETATPIPPNLDDQISPHPQAINSSADTSADVAQTTEKKTTIKVSKLETQTTEQKKALAILENKTDNTNTASTKTFEKELAKTQKKLDAKIMLQVGAFSTAARVEEVKKQLQKAGIHKIYTEEVATRSGQVIRIRVGPLNTQQQAEILRKKITSLGFNPTIIQ